MGRLRAAVDAVKARPADEVLERPPQQLADEIRARFELELPVLLADAATGSVTDTRVDVSHDHRRAVFDRSGPVLIDGTRVTFHAPYQGCVEALRLRASTFSMSPPRATVGKDAVTVYRDVPADVLEREREKVIEELRGDLRRIDEMLGHARKDISEYNEQLAQKVTSAAEARRNKVLADRDTEAMLGVPLVRDGDAAKSYRVTPVERKRVTPRRAQRGREAFTPEPAIDDDAFSDIVSDLVSITRTFERLAVTYAEMAEERLRDQILAMLGNVYGPTTGESFSKRGKSDIYLPWDGGNAVFLAECKWWSGEKAFREHDLPQLLDRYVVWRDTHAAMVLFIRNKDASVVIDKAKGAIRGHERFLRDGDQIEGAPVFMLHKDGDPDREIALALVTAAIHK
jgi:hypothetical protein